MSAAATTRPGTPGRGVRYGATAAGFIAPAIVLCTVLLYLPFLWTGYLSLTEFNGLGDPEFVGLANYASMFSDDGFLGSPGMVMTSPVSTTMNPAPVRGSSSRTWST